MDKHKKQSQDMFDEELRHEMREAEEAQKRVWEKIQKMSPEERRKMAAGVPGPEDREELPLGTSYKPMPRRRLGGAIKVGALAAAALLVVISSGTFSIGNKEHEYHVIENSNGIANANNSDVLGTEGDINNKITVLTGMLQMESIIFDYWPDTIQVGEVKTYAGQGYGIIECSLEEDKIYIGVYKNNVDQITNIFDNAEIVENIKNSNTVAEISIMKKTEKNKEKMYIGVVSRDNECFCLSGFKDISLLRDILYNIKNENK